MSNAKFLCLILLVIASLGASAVRLIEVNNSPVRYKWADKKGQYCAVVGNDNVHHACSSFSKEALNSMHLEYDKPPAE